MKNRNFIYGPSNGRHTTYHLAHSTQRPMSCAPNCDSNATYIDMFNRSTYSARESAQYRSAEHKQTVCKILKAHVCKICRAYPKGILEVVDGWRDDSWYCDAHI